MNEALPLDSDGDALRQLVAHGSDLSKEMDIDFAVSVPDQKSGLAFAVAVEPMGFRTKVSKHDATNKWTCYCSQVMMPSYEAIVETQMMLEELGKPYNAIPDGWGTFGNA
jgi:hypothetical protein